MHISSTFHWKINSHNLQNISNEIRNSYTFSYLSVYPACSFLFHFYIPSPITHTCLEAALLFFPTLSLNKKALHRHRKSPQRTELIGYRSESQSGADICWDQNPKPDNLHTVWPSTQPCVCMSECYTLVSWSYLSFFHAERGRLGRRGLDMLPLCCFRPLCMWRNFWNYIIYHTANTHSHTHPVNQTHAHRHFDIWLRRKDTLPVPEEKHSHFVFRNVISCVSPIRIPVVLSGCGLNQSCWAAVKGLGENGKSLVRVWYALLKLYWSVRAAEKPHKHIHT